jgi:hypothetical protein
LLSFFDVLARLSRTRPGRVSVSIASFFTLFVTSISIFIVSLLSELDENRELGAHDACAPVLRLLNRLSGVQRGVHGTRTTPLYSSGVAKRIMYVPPASFSPFFYWRIVLVASIISR